AFLASSPGGIAASPDTRRSLSSATRRTGPEGAGAGAPVGAAGCAALGGGAAWATLPRVRVSSRASRQPLSPTPTHARGNGETSSRATVAPAYSGGSGLLILRTPRGSSTSSGARVLPPGGVTRNSSSSPRSVASGSRTTSSEGAAPGATVAVAQPGCGQLGSAAPQRPTRAVVVAGVSPRCLR